MRCGRCNKIGQGLRAFFNVCEVKNPFSETPEESWHAVFKYVTARAEQRGAGRQILSEREQIVFVSARAMKEQQGRGKGISPDLEYVLIGKFHRE